MAGDRFDSMVRDLGVVEGMEQRSLLYGLLGWMGRIERLPLPGSRFIANLLLTKR